MRITDLEIKLNHFDSRKREEALYEIAELMKADLLSPAPEDDLHNLHCHTFFSYNGYGYSPSYIAYIAKIKGWFAAGIVDFDVLDAVDEFLKACLILNIRALCGVETRAFIKEFSELEINSPGEPGIAYHMGVGFTKSIPDSLEAKNFLKQMRQRARNRTELIVKKVNQYLFPVELDFVNDVLPLTPAGNVTERHVCAAYEKKASEIFKKTTSLAKFWSEKLELERDVVAKLLVDSVALQGKIRAKTMKSGGVGYISPTPESFPPLSEFNDFIIACGGVPAIAWLDGLSSGEQGMDNLLDLHISYGAAVLNIIPDRNWNISDEKLKVRKLAELKKIIKACNSKDMPIIIGTEMNAPGQKLVDSLDAPELEVYTGIFKTGAAIMTAHTKLVQEGKGYLSEWASSEFNSIAEKNNYFENIGLNLLKK